SLLVAFFDVLSLAFLLPGILGLFSTGHRAALLPRRGFGKTPAHPRRPKAGVAPGAGPAGPWLMSFPSGCLPSLALLLVFLLSLDLGGGLQVALLGGHLDHLALLQVCELAFLAIGSGHLRVGGQRVTVLLTTLVLHHELLVARRLHERPLVCVLVL